MIYKLNISISSDYAKDMVEKRELLWKGCASDRDSGEKPCLVHDKHRIDDQMYEWDVEHSER